MEHIPKGTTEFQWQLRAFYPMARKGDLGKKGDPTRTPGDALKAAIAYVHEKHPGAKLDYDRPYFGVE